MKKDTRIRNEVKMNNSNNSTSTPQQFNYSTSDANGSGKSTILKMLNGIFMQDKGKIEINGRVGALIEVGAGFHPLLTGRENIYVNGAILGMSKEEIDEKFDDIVEFADIGDFLDTPIKNYTKYLYRPFTY